MIDEGRNLEIYGYTSDELKPKSHKPIVAVCEECGRYRVVQKRSYHELCHLCANQTIEHLHNLSEAHMGYVHTADSKHKLSMAHKNRSPEAEAARRYKLSMAHKNHSPEEKADISHKLSIAKQGNTNSVGRTHSEETRRKMSEAHNNRTPPSEETRRKMSEAQQNRTPEQQAEKSRKLSEAHKNRTPEQQAETRRKMSEAHKNRTPEQQAETRRKMSEAQQNRTPISEETRVKQSCAKQGISIDEWDGYAVESKYCPKFNEACRERNREKYGRRCFICDKPEAENGRKLSVHHVDMNKFQGCDGHVWQLVPVCMEHHKHDEETRARIEYLLNNVW